MVSPIYIIAASLLFAFLYPLIERAGKEFARWAGVLLLAVFTGLSANWLVAMLQGGDAIIVQTAGFSAPLSINLMVGNIESLLLVLVNGLALLTLIYQIFIQSENGRNGWQGKQVVLFFVLILGANGLVMTRDLFNVFVFMEITSIALYGILSTSKDLRSYEAGFKYMIAGGLASAFYLIGLAFLYRESGTLNLDHMLEYSGGIAAGLSGLIAMVLFVTGILVELKPVFANGWALDTYQAGDPAVGAILSGIITSAMLAVLLKILPLTQAAAPIMMDVLILTGGLSFIVSSLMAYKQTSLRRMLGLSSVAQTGLIILAAVIQPAAGGIAAVWLIVNHGLAKAGIFWISGIIDSDEAVSGRSLRHRPVLLILAGVGVFALVGLPPFPSFWVKWELLSVMAGSGGWLIFATILGGSLLEAGYLFHWFISLASSCEDSLDRIGESVPADSRPAQDASSTEAVPADRPAAAQPEVNDSSDAPAPGNSGISAGAVLAPAGAIAVLLGMGLFMSWGSVSFWSMFPLLALLTFAFLDLIRIPVRIQLLAAITGLGYTAYRVLPVLNGVTMIFMLMFLGGAAIQLIAFFHRKGASKGSIALVTGMILSLGSIVMAGSALELFFAWELMTFTSLLLILRGHHAGAGALRYIMFSLLSAYALLTGLFLMGAPVQISGALPYTASFFNNLVQSGSVPVLSGLFLALAALIKLGNIGFHLWLGPSYAEADDDVSALLSSVLSKAGVFLLILTGAVLSFSFTSIEGFHSLGIGSLNGILGWIGAITAVAGAMMALFQEDIKYTLAYSSMGQVGYMVLAISMMTHLGHVTGLYLAITHLLFKGMLWLAVLGIIQRTGTRLMYKMGGLIKTMPFSFVSVLFAIIAVSGVPPLSGFGGKWLLYTALLEKGWYLQAGLAMFSSGVAFLYLYRLIHSMFLGQPKDELIHVKEAPWYQLVPQYLFMGGIMAVSMYPNLIIKPLQAAVEPLFPSTISWNGYEVVSALGYWNGNAVMYVTMGVFVLPLIWLIVVNGKKVQKVNQFNIVYSAERPHKPETTHYSYNFFAHYDKALGFLMKPWAGRFWGGLSSVTSTIGDVLRRWNTGNPQTYGFQILLYLLVVFLISRGGM